MLTDSKVSCTERVISPNKSPPRSQFLRCIHNTP